MPTTVSQGVSPSWSTLRKRLADRVLAGPEALGERPAHDHHRQRARSVASPRSPRPRRTGRRIDRGSSPGSTPARVHRGRVRVLRAAAGPRSRRLASCCRSRAGRTFATVTARDARQRRRSARWRRARTRGASRARHTCGRRARRRTSAAGPGRSPADRGGAQRAERTGQPGGRDQHQRGRHLHDDEARCVPRWRPPPAVVRASAVVQHVVQRPRARRAAPGSR